LSEHLSAEYSEPVTLRGQTFDKWGKLPDRGDNHWLDCFVGAAVAASVHGVNWDAAAVDMPVTAEMSQPKKRVSLRELQEQRRREKERTAKR
jgi:phage terminase large subunit GpA-like protein